MLHPCRLVQDAAVLECVVHQCRQDLMQVLGVDQGMHRGALDAGFQDVGLHRQGLPVFHDEAAHERGQVQVFRAGALAPGQAEHAFDNAVGALALLMDDLQQAAVGIADVRRFFQQLRGVVDGRQRVADLVGQAGREPAHGREGQRFGAPRDHAGIVQEDQHQVAVGEQAHEARLHFGAVRAQLQRGFFLAPAAAPALQPARQFRGERGQGQVGRGVALVAVAEQCQGGFVGQGDAVVGIDHQHAGAHAADDQLVDFVKVGDLRAALFGQRLVAARARGDLLADVGHRHVAGGEHGQLGHRAGGAAFQ